MAKRIMPAIAVCLCGLSLCLVAKGPILRTLSSARDAAAPPVPEAHVKTERGKVSARPPRAGIRAEDAIVAALRSDRTDARREALDTLLPDLMRRDMHAAADLAADLEPWASADEAMRKVIDAWAESDPEAAAAWASALTDDAKRPLALSLICNKAARTNPAAAMELAEKNSLTSDTDLTGNLLQLWASRDADAAGAWVERQTDRELRDRCWARIAMAKAAALPEEAATLAVNRISEGQVQEEAVISVLHQWTLRDASAAASWVNLFPEGPLRQRAEGELNPSH